MLDNWETMKWVVGAFATAFGWLLRELWFASKELRRDLSKLREELPRDYILKNDFEAILGRIDDKLDKLFDRLNGKADK